MLDIDLVDLGGQRLRTAVGGARQAPRTLLLFNGIGANLETMAPFMARFVRTRVIAFDVPGVGGSPLPKAPYRMRSVAALGACLLDHFGIAQAHAFGVSWGGAAAQEFALRHTERCRTLTLAATTSGFPVVPGRPRVLLELLSPRRYLDPGHLVRVGGRLYGGALRLERDLLEMHAEAMRDPSRLGYGLQLLAIAGWTSWPRLHRLRLPALVLAGADDPIVPPINGRIVAAQLRHARLETIDCGHLFVLTRPGETAARVEAFLEAHPGEAPTVPSPVPARPGTGRPRARSRRR